MTISASGAHISPIVSALGKTLGLDVSYRKNKEVSLCVVRGRRGEEGTVNGKPKLFPFSNRQTLIMHARLRHFSRQPI
jgi:hypothetical protein